MTCARFLRISMLLGTLVHVNSGCLARSIPDPKDAAVSYALAAERGDSDAIYEMMTDSARKSLSKSDVRKLVSEEKKELIDQGRTFSSKDVRVVASARLRFDDGEESALDLKNGRFYVTSSGAVPGGAHTPEEALDQLRRVLARRSYAGLMRVLSPGTRAAIEQDLRGLVTGLEHPETLPVQVNGESATIKVPGGHLVRLKRDGGIWRVDNFD